MRHTVSKCIPNCCAGPLSPPRLIFKRNVLPLLKKINGEVSSNNKDEVVTMMSVVPKLSYAISHYASHFLHVNVDISAIDKNMQSMKTDPSIMYMVPDHKQKVFPDVNLGGTG